MDKSEIAVPDKAAEPLAAFLLGKDIRPEYPNGADVYTVARALLAKCAAPILAAELERQADVVQGWREDGDEEADFRTFRDHLRSRAAELRAASATTPGPDGTQHKAPWESLAPDEDGRYIVWRKAREAYDAGEFDRSSTTELAVLDLAIALGENRYQITSMGRTNREMVERAMRTALGWERVS